MGQCQSNRAVQETCDRISSSRLAKANDVCAASVSTTEASAHTSSNAAAATRQLLGDVSPMATTSATAAATTTTLERQCSGTCSVSSSTDPQHTKEPQDSTTTVDDSEMDETRKACNSTTINRELSASAHRRCTLEYQAQRRLELEREAANRLTSSTHSSLHDRLGSHHSTTSTTSTITTSSRRSMRMPPRASATAASKRNMFQRQNSWFTLSYEDGNASEGSLDMIDDNDSCPSDSDVEDDNDDGAVGNVNHNKDDECHDSTSRRTMDMDMSSWSAIDVNGGRRAVPNSKRALAA